MELEFQSLEELYTRIFPALRTKKREIRRMGYSFITEEDIWNYLKEEKWKKSENLSLSDMVNDILESEAPYIAFYLKEKLQNKKRHLYFED